MNITKQSNTNELIIDGNSTVPSSNINITRTSSPPISDDDIDMLASHNLSTTDETKNNSINEHLSEHLSEIEEEESGLESDNDSKSQFNFDTNNDISDDDSDNESSGSEVTASTLDEDETAMSVSSSRPKTYEEINMEKQEILYGFEKLERYNLKPSNNYNMSSDINQMRAEFKKLVRIRNVQKSIKTQRLILNVFVRGIEFVSDRFISTDTINLNGWSENVAINIDDFDEVFEELYDKYKDTIELMPELKLIGLIGMSGFTFAMGKKVGGSFDMSKFLKKNPDIKKQFVKEGLKQQINQASMSGPPEDIDALLNSM